VLLVAYVSDSGTSFNCL